MEHPGLAIVRTAGAAELTLQRIKAPTVGFARAQQAKHGPVCLPAQDTLTTNWQNVRIWVSATECRGYAVVRQVLLETPVNALLAPTTAPGTESASRSSICKGWQIPCHLVTISQPTAVMRLRAHLTRTGSMAASATLHGQWGMGLEKCRPLSILAPTARSGDARLATTREPRGPVAWQKSTIRGSMRPIVTCETSMARYGGAIKTPMAVPTTLCSLRLRGRICMAPNHPQGRTSTLARWVTNATWTAQTVACATLTWACAIASPARTAKRVSIWMCVPLDFDSQLN